MNQSATRDAEVYIETLMGLRVLAVPKDLTQPQRDTLAAMRFVSPRGKPRLRLISARMFRMRTPSDEDQVDLGSMLNRIDATRNKRKRADIKRAERTRKFIDHLLSLDVADAANLLIVERRSTKPAHHEVIIYMVGTPNGYHPEVLHGDSRIEHVIRLAARIAAERNIAQGRWSGHPKQAAIPAFSVAPPVESPAEAPTPVLATEGAATSPAQVEGGSAALGLLRRVSSIARAVLFRPESRIHTELSGDK